jgi:DNA-binding transcriptional ArsR family regulator
MSQKILFSDDEAEELANKFKILSEASRLKILRALFRGEKCVNEICLKSSMQQANVSKQLGILLKNNVVECRKDGLNRYYQIIDPDLIQMCKQLCKSKAKKNNVKS